MSAACVNKLKKTYQYEGQENNKSNSNNGQVTRLKIAQAKLTTPCHANN